MPALVSSSFFSTVMSAPISEEEEVLPPEAEAAEGAVGCFVSVVGYGRHEYTL